MMSETPAAGAHPGGGLDVVRYNCVSSPGPDQGPRKDDVRFDMLDAESTQSGPAPRALAELGHDLNPEGSRFTRKEAPEVALLVTGTASLRSRYAWSSP